jgi:hypothetical protein
MTRDRSLRHLDIDAHAITTLVRPEPIVIPKLHGRTVNRNVVRDGAWKVNSDARACGKGWYGRAELSSVAPVGSSNRSLPYPLKLPRFAAFFAGFDHDRIASNRLATGV